MADGKIKSWNDERGFGFIEPRDGGQDVFVHIRAFEGRAKRPVVNQQVSFDVEIGPNGRKRACNVQPLRVARMRPARRDGPGQWGTVTLLAIPAFLMIYGTVDILWKPPAAIGAAYLGASLLTFAVYWWDKSAALQGAPRVSELALHALALAGGWPGALLAQQLLRHKSTKARFRRMFWAMVLLNGAAFVLLSSPVGRWWAPTL